MPFLWYTAGILTDFDYTNDFIQSTTPMRSGVAIGSTHTFERTIYKILPEQVSEIWCSMYMDYPGRSMGMELLKTDNATVLCRVIIENNYYVVYALVNGAFGKIGTGATVISTGTNHQAELYYKRDASAGMLQLWVDGALEITFTGNTGLATDIINSFAIYWPGYFSSGYTERASEIILTNKGRIGKKRMQVMYLSGAGDVNTTEGFMDVLGNNSTTTKTTLKTGTYIIPSAFKAAGVLKTVSFKLSAADTVKVGIFSRNGTTLKFTPDAARQVSVSCLAGVVTLNSGTDFSEWSVGTGEYLGLYTATATLIGAGTYDGAIADGFEIIGWDHISGDAFALGNEQTYTGDSYSYVCAYCLYLTPTNIMYIYNNNVGVITEKPWQESKRYMSMSADSQEFLNNCTDLTDAECTAVTALKVTVRAEAGTSIANGQLSIKAAGETTYSDLLSMPTVVNKRHFIFEGVWSKASINALQVGFKARS